MSKEYGKREYSRLQSEANRESQRLEQLQEHKEKLQADQRQLERRLSSVNRSELSSEEKERVAAELRRAIDDVRRQYQKEVHDPMMETTERLKDLAADAQSQAKEMQRLSEELRKARMDAAKHDASVAAQNAKSRKVDYQRLHDDITQKLQAAISGETGAGFGAEDIDFSVSANTQAELQQIREMEETGELPRDVVGQEPPKDLVYRLPGKEKGSFQGTPGESMFIPKDSGMQQLLGKFNQTGVMYKNMEPNFRPFCTHDTPWGKLECQVQIGHMTADRTNRGWEYGRRSGLDSYSAEADAGNYHQADAALCDAILKANPHLLENRDRDSVRLNMCRQITAYRKQSGLTWHECGDGTTMQLVPRKINDYFSHTGGTSLSGWLSEWGAVDV